MKKKGVLLVNLGTPDSPNRGDVYKYLKEFLLDPRVIDVGWLKRNLVVRGIIAPFRSKETSELYKELWTEEGSPIKVYGYELKDQVQELLGKEYIVELAMRYQSPSIEEGMESLLSQAVDEITVLPLFPQYASASTGSVHEEVMRVLSKKQVIVPLKLINSFYDNEGMIKVFADHAREYEIDDYDHVLFSFHGLPERQMIKADSSNHCLQSKDCCKTITDKNKFCYSAQCHGTAQAIAKDLGLSEDQYTVCYQSRLGKEPWIQPFTSDTMEERIKAGDKKLLVFSPAFVADCLETTIEISREYKDDFIAAGGEQLDLVASLNNDPAWAKTVAEMVKEA